MKRTDKPATAIGAALAAMQLAGIDYGKLAQGDRVEIIRLAMAGLFAALGWIANRGMDASAAQ